MTSLMNRWISSSPCVGCRSHRSLSGDNADSHQLLRVRCESARTSMRLRRGSSLSAPSTNPSELLSRSRSDPDLSSGDRTLTHGSPLIHRTIGSRTRWPTKCQCTLERETRGSSPFLGQPGPGFPLRQELIHGRGIQRAREEKSLPRVDSLGDQLVTLFVALHTLGNGLESEDLA